MYEIWINNHFIFYMHQVDFWTLYSSTSIGSNQKIIRSKCNNSIFNFDDQVPTINIIIPKSTYFKTGTLRCWYGFLTCFLPIFEFYWISFNSYINSNFGGKQSENKFDFKKEFVGWHQDLKYCGLENTEEQGGKVQMVTMWLAIDKVLYN